MRVLLECLVADLAAVPAVVGRSSYRIVQEGLTNARKHAPGAQVSVTVRGAAGGGLTVEIRNPWPVDPAGTADMPGGTLDVPPGTVDMPGGTAAIPGAGIGIIGLAERASLAGGRLEHGPTPDGDFRLQAWLPWPA
jgi:signal transduction histidine kinase